MMEAGASIVDEDIVYEAIQIAQNVNLEVISLQEDFIEEAGQEKSDFVPRGHDPAAVEKARDILGNKIYEAMRDSSAQDDMRVR